jgi:RING finger protein 113A
MRKKTEAIEKDNVNTNPEEIEERKDEDEELRIFKKQKTKNSVISATSKDVKKGAEEAVNFSFKSSQSAVPAGSADQHATAESTIDGDDIKGESSAEGYKGLKNYALAGKKETTSRFGPQRGSAHIRATVRMDYQPDLCKDYKETGYCGYGDSCKFLHDRGDYKAGWQLDKEWDEKEKAKRDGQIAAVTGEEGEYFVGDEDDKLPFACFICRKPFKDPIVTICGHYFCEDCATTRYRKDPRCYVCKEHTKGVFNVATNILKRQKQQEPEEPSEHDAGPEDD